MIYLNDNIEAPIFLGCEKDQMSSSGACYFWDVAVATPTKD